MTVCYCVEKMHSKGTFPPRLMTDVWKDPLVIYRDLGKSIKSLTDDGFVEVPKDFYQYMRQPNVVWHGRKHMENGEHPVSGYVYTYEYVD